MTDEKVHEATDPGEDTGISVVGPGDKLECGVCGSIVGRFVIKYWGQNQYCPDCWEKIEPHKRDSDCSLCGEEFRKNPLEPNLATWRDGQMLRLPNLCDGCTKEVFPDYE